MFKNCKNCYFAQTENGEQSGCQLNKLDLLKRISNYEIDEGFYSFGRFCFFGRSYKWAERNAGTDLGDLVNQENVIQYTIFLPIHDRQQLIDFRTNYSEQIKGAERVWILNYSSMLPISILQHLERPDNVHVTTPVDDVDISPDYLIYQKLTSYAGRTRFIWVVDDASESPSPNILDNLNKRINDEFEMILSISGKGHSLVFKELFMAVIQKGQVSVWEYIANELRKNNPRMLKESQVE